MRLFYKFYDTDAPADQGVATNSGGIASLMAKSGVLRHLGDDGPVPSINTTKKEETQPAPATPAPATDAAPAEKASESSKPPKETIKEQPQTVAPQPQPTWQEVLKSQQPKDILKELGYGDNLVNFLSGRKDLDAKMTGFFDHWERNEGNVEPYLRALTTDFTKMKPEDVMRYQLQVENPELDAKQLDRLYKLKVVDRYKLDPQLFSEEEVSDGQIELMADVKPIRTTLAAKHQELLFNKPEPKAPEVNNELQEQQQRIAAYKTYISEHPAVKALLTNKILSIGEGEDKFDYPVDPAAILDLLTDDQKWADSMYVKHQLPDGSTKAELDVEGQILLGLLRTHKGFLSDFAKHYKTLGGSKAIAPIENAKPPASGEPAKSEVVESSPAAAAAKRGRLVPGGQ